MLAGLAQRLLDMVEEECRANSELTAKGEINQGYPPRLAEVNQRHALALARP